MQPLEKLNILIGLQLPSIQNMNINSELEESFAAKISQLSNAIGMQLLDIWDQLSMANQQDSAMSAYMTLQSFLPFIFKLFADQDDQTSSNVVEFMNTYIQLLRKKSNSLSGGGGASATLSGTMTGTTPATILVSPPVTNSSGVGGGGGSNASVLTETELAEVGTMIRIVRQKARFTEDYIFDPEKQDEYEANFLEYRRVCCMDCLWLAVD